MGNIKFRECPFCGNEDENYMDVSKDDGMDYRFYSWCDACDCQGPKADTAKEAIKKWNERIDD
jgi:Lar family restriction alleviation protein